MVRGHSVTATALSAGQIKQYALNAGFTGSGADTITAIALAESGGNPNAFNPNDPSGGSFGLTQINGVHQGAAMTLGNPQEALNQAFTISNGGTNFGPWSTYTNGAYQQYIPAAQAGTQTLTASGGTVLPSVTMDYSIAGDGIPGQGNDPVAGGGTVGSEIANPGVDIPGTGSVGNAIANPVTYGNYSGYSGGAGSGITNAATTAATGASSAATAAAGTSWFDWFTTSITDLLVRFGVIVLGVILVGIAAYQFAKEQDIVPPIKIPVE